MAEIFASKTSEIEEREVLHGDISRNLAGECMVLLFTSQDMPMITGKFKPTYPISASTGCIYAGNDIQMPGCQKNVDDIVEAVKTGKEIDGYKITKADLQFNAANVIRVVAWTM